VPYEASLVKILPKAFSKVNKHNMPTFGLFASSIVMDLFLLMVVMADDVYLTALHITGLMIIPGYLFTGLFLIKKADNWKIMTIAVITTLFCIWMAYSGGLLNMFLTSIFYILGTGFYIKTNREREAPGTPLFTTKEKYFFIILCIASLISAYILISRLL
ncbi:MAG: arginine:ornithine antiporter, partial [Muribaculaceae bacterium]|nr:arginine:ornithine antiporter [Muribaculaceae bacterium]